MVRLSDWLAHLSLPLPVAQELAGIEVNSLTLDSRQVTKDSAFFAICGHELDGREFIPAAVDKGAAFVIAETPERSEHLHLSYQSQVPVLLIFELSAQLSSLASHFHSAPSTKMAVMGVTGTNGKTSTVRFIAELNRALGQAITTVGTLGCDFNGEQVSGHNTTPDAITVQDICQQSLQKGIDALAMEVSSHAVVQHRVDAIDFDSAIFTNLSRDHLDYHGTMEAYGAAKQRLFQQANLRHAIVNVDDVFGLKLTQHVTASAKLWTYGHSAHDRANHIQILSHEYTANGISAKLKTDEGEIDCQLNILGDFNLMNAVAAMIALVTQGYSWPQVANAVASLSPVAGRMEPFTTQNNALAVVDYAHTPDALEKALQSLRHHCDEELWCLFGCGGNRDKGKRSLMGSAAQEFADRIVVTSDNPRHEEPMDIINDILVGMDPDSAIVIADRQQAIRQTLACAKEGDIVLVAGKGHETYQQIGDEKRDYDERAYVEQLCQGDSA